MLEEERYRVERLEVQINDMTELQQHEMHNLRQVRISYIELQWTLIILLLFGSSYILVIREGGNLLREKFTYKLHDLGKFGLDGDERWGWRIKDGRYYEGALYIFISVEILKKYNKNEIRCSLINRWICNWQILVRLTMISDCCLTSSGKFFAVSWWEQNTFKDEMMTVSVFYETNAPSWIFDSAELILLQSDILSWLLANQSLL